MSKTSEKKYLVSYFSFVCDVSDYELGCIGYHIFVCLSIGNGQLIRLTSAARSAIVVGQMRRATMIKQLVAGAALSLAAQSSMAFYVLGDSVSAWKESWPQVMREQYGSWVRSDVQSGRALVSYDASGDLAGLDGHGQLGILALGFNDGTYAHHGLTTAEDYGRALRNTVNNWHNAAFPFRKVMIVIPPNTRLSEKAHDDVRFQAQLYCAIMIHYWQQEWLHCVDWSDIGYYDNTSDGVHPTTSFSREIAAYMYNEINNFAPEAL